MSEETLTVEMTTYEAQMAVNALNYYAIVSDKKTEQEGGSPKDDHRRNVAEKLAERIDEEATPLRQKEFGLNSPTEDDSSGN